MVTSVTPPPSDIGSADPETLEKYNAALDAQVKALENRGGTNWFNIAAAFANPGRTGSFGEAFGNAMGVVGKQRETDEAQALPIAQMRASLVGQKYQMQKEQESNKALISALGGGNAADIMQTISSPQGAFGNPGLYQALVRAQMVAQPGTSAAAKIDKLLKTQQEMIELGIKQGTLNVQQVESQFNFGVTPLNSSSVTAPTAQTAGQPNAQPNAASSGPQRAAPPEFNEEPTARDSLINTLHGTFNIPKENLSTTRTREEQQSIFDRWKKGEKGLYMPVDPSKVPNQKEFHSNAIDVPTTVDENWMNAQGWYRPFPKADPVHYEPITKGTPAPNTAAAPNAAPAASTGTPTAGGWTKLSDTQYQLPSGTIVPFPPGTPQKTINEYMAKAAAEEKTTSEEMLRTMGKDEIAAYSKKRADLISQNEGQLSTQIGDLSNTIKILSNPKFERVVGLLQAKDPESEGTVFGSIINGVRSLAAGAQEGLKIGNYGSVSAPIEEMMRTQNFTKQERAAFNEVRNTIASGLIATIQGAGKALGVNPTDADRLLYEMASASTSNLAANTIYWAQKRLAQTQFEYSAVTGIKDYVGKHPAEYFTKPTSPYSKAQKEYKERMAKIQTRAPGTEEE
jgi:hypothetical protein